MHKPIMIRKYDMLLQSGYKIFEFTIPKDMVQHVVVFSVSALMFCSCDSYCI